jgi:outer membrane protein TolC
MTAGHVVGAAIAAVVVSSAVALAQQSGTAYDLKSAVAAALRNNPSVSAAGARLRAATTRIAAAGAQYRPFVEARASLGGTLAGDNDVTFRDDIATRSFDANPFYTGAVRLVLPIVREGTSPFLELPSEVLAKSGQAGARQAERLARAETVGNVTMAFYSMLAVREYHNGSRDVVTLSQALRDSVQRRFERQLVPQVDVLSAESALATARGELGVAEQNLAKARELFALSLGLNPSSEAARSLEVVKGEDSRRPPVGLEELLRQTTTNHPSVLVQQAKVQEAEAARALLRTERYPTLDAVLAAGAIDDFEGSVEGWSLRALLRLNWKIYDFGALGLRIKEQEELISAERRTLEHVRNQLSQSVVTAYRNVEGSRLRLASAEKAVELAMEESRVAARREQQGVAPASDTFKARVKEAAARRELAQATYAVLIEEAAVVMATGAE